MSEHTKRLAVLIDAENAQASILGDLLSEIANLGVASVKRIYGDFTSPAVRSWSKQLLLKYSIQPVQLFSGTTGKNASDIALIIDAMDLLHSRRFDGFCLVSSDSDFTRLASRIREEGLLVYGFGEKKTPESLVAACDRFIYTEILRPPPIAVREATAAKSATKKSGTRKSGARNDAQGHEESPYQSVLRHAVDASVDESGWAHLGRVGHVVSNRLPDFDPRNFGHRNLLSLVESAGGYEVKRKGASGGRQAVYVRVKSR